MWPFSTISTLRARELDYNRQIATLTARLDILTQENTRLSQRNDQYIEDLRRIANLSAPAPDSTSNGSSDEPVGVPLLRSKVKEALDEFRTKPLDMLGANGPWYQRAVELNQDTPADSQEGTD